MYNGNWSSGNLYRAHRRAAPAAALLAFQVPDQRRLRQQVRHRAALHRGRPGIPWNPADTYRVRVEWGGGRAGFTVTSLSGAGQWSFNRAYGNATLGGVYNPANHRVAIGNPRAGGGEHGSFPGMRIRNVRIGTR